MTGSNLGRDLRALREHRGWTRETLAHHAGVSWAAIAQIEAGRRPDPRLRTLTSVADALGVTLDQLTGRARTANGAPTTVDHRALLYSTDDEFVDASVPFLMDGLKHSDAVLAVTDRSRISQLRRALGGDARKVSFRESSSWYSSPQTTLHAYRKFLLEKIGAGHPWVRILGEPVWAGHPKGKTRAWTRYEAILNLSFSGSPVTIMCPYDTRTLAASIVADARCTHPQLTREAGSVESPDYRNPEAFLLAN